MSKRISFLLSFTVLKVSSWLFIILPLNLGCKIAMLACGVAAKVMKKRFGLNMQNIARVFPEKSPEEVYSICMDSWKNMGRIMVEFIKAYNMSKEELSAVTEFKNFHYLQHQIDIGQAAIIHTGHFPNWEIFGISVSALGIKKAVIAQGQKNPYINKEITKMRCAYGGTVIDTDNPFFACVKWLKKGNLLGILSDQNSYKSEVYRKFFGRYCACSPLTPLLSLKLQIPVIPVKLYRKSGKFIIEFLEPIQPAEKYSQEEVNKFIDVLNKYYEDWIRENPSDWLWAHNRWKREHNAPQYKAEHE